MKKLLSKFLKSELKINIVVTIIFLSSVGLMYLGVLKPKGVYQLLGLTLLLVSLYPLCLVIKNKFIFVNSHKILLFSIKGLSFLVINIAIILLFLFVVLDSFFVL
jgi:hypothetical protein